jgi:pyruvate-formate lyase
MLGCGCKSVKTKRRLFTMAWTGFKGTKWMEEVNVRDFIQNNYTPYDGDDEFLAGPTEATNKLWEKVMELTREEQAKGGVVDCRADLYSLGAVLYEMLTGKTPFDGETPVSVALQHLSGKAALPRELNPSIPEGLEQITMHAMEADRWKRYSSASQML